ncbi:MAG: FeoB-associated Cys-rich membrane protein [Prevotella sp.]|nr:FeoB-associated Cys-rich membrane protein [Prevotella sp.]MDD7045631.1 FeoB-associated Cys-rich membrane protein [Prevotella sp.]MDY5546946.1 FeoB-associated Cys-rich membrane protein [Prevotella sp.]
MQLILTLIIVAAAAGYGLWRIYAAIKTAGNPCYGCSGCELHKALKGKHIRRNTGCRPQQKTCKGKKNVEKK